MNALHLNTDFLLNVLASLVILAATGHHWLERTLPGRTSLITGLTLTSLWSLLKGVELILPDLEQKRQFVILASSVGLLAATFIPIFMSEFTGSKLLTRRHIAYLWTITGLLIVLEQIPAINRLMWLSYIVNPNNPKLLVFNFSLLYFVDLVYTLSLPIGACILAGWEAFTSKGWKRKRAIWMTIVVLLPYQGYFLEFSDPFNPFANDLVLLGTASMGLALSWVAILDMRQLVREQIEVTDQYVASLETEIGNRKKLEDRLVAAQDALAKKVAFQTRKLTNLYDLILLGGSKMGNTQMLEAVLPKLIESIGCDSACYLNLAGDGVALSCTRHTATLQAGGMQLAWVIPGPDVSIFSTGYRANTLPEEVRLAGFSACAGRQVRIKEQVRGTFACFWLSSHEFQTEEISLVGALAEFLGFLLENIQLHAVEMQAATFLERRRLARDLHDSVMQSLHSQVMDVQSARKAIENRPDKLPRILDQIYHSAQLALKEMRLMLFDMRIFEVADFSLLPALEERINTVERRVMVDTQLVVEQGSHWPLAWERDLYSFCIEALNNILKHAKASYVTVRIAATEGRLDLQVVDNGCGFDVSAARNGGFGLAGMAERAESIGGALHIESAPGKGTCIRLVADI